MLPSSPVVDFVIVDCGGIAPNLCTRLSTSDYSQKIDDGNVLDSSRPLQNYLDPSHKTQTGQTIKVFSNLPCKHPKAALG